jgi:predicted  nucleic acid-binding Zn-ribbon protein
LKTILEALRSLQTIDSEVYEIEAAKKGIESKVKELKRIRDAILEDLSDKKKRLKEAEDWYAAKNAELEADKRKINESRSKLTGIKKNKEYLALQKEIETLRKTNEKKEEEILKLLEAIDRFREGTVEQEKKLSLIEEEIGRSEAEVEREVLRLEEKIREKSSSKEEHLKHVPTRYMGMYKRVFDKRNGLAVVPVNDGTCTGCNMRLQPQMVIRLLRKESIETCPNCSRFLFIDEGGAL